MRADKYSTLLKFVDDCRLIWKNCRQFNLESPITELADALSKKFEQNLSKLSPEIAQVPVVQKAKKPSKVAGLPPASKDPKVPFNDASRKICAAYLSNLTQQDMAVDFAAPFDPVMFNYVGYDDVIEKRMDLSTAKQHLDGGKYESPKDLFDDIFRCFQNALKYHGTPESTKLAAQFLLNQCKVDFLEMFPGTNVYLGPWVPRARKALATITQYDYGNLFGEPVNPVRFMLYDYFERIKKPIDLLTIKVSHAGHPLTCTPILMFENAAPLELWLV